MISGHISEFALVTRSISEVQCVGWALYEALFFKLNHSKSALNRIATGKFDGPLATLRNCDTSLMRQGRTPAPVCRSILLRLKLAECEYLWPPSIEGSHMGAPYSYWKSASLPW